MSPTRQSCPSTAGAARGILRLVVALLTLTAIGCGESTTAPPPSVPLALSTTVSGDLAPAGLAPGELPTLGASGDVVPGGAGVNREVSATDSEGNEITVTLAVVLVEEVRVHPRGVGECGGGACVDSNRESLLLQLPLDGSVASVGLLTQVDAGVYDRLEFELRPATDADAAAVDSFPEMEGASVLVRGSFNGEPFTFTSDAGTAVTVRVSPALDLSDSPAAANVTMAAPPSRWFFGEDGTLLDPSDPGVGATVSENVAQSFTAFPDLDADGEPDRSGPAGPS